MKSIPYKYIVGIVFVFGLFMDLLDMTITNVALPTLATDFHTDTTTIEWVVTGYLLSLAVFIPVSGWAGDRFGTKRIFMFALAVFVTGSALCGLAWSDTALIGFRVLQGVGGGMLTPVGTAMLFRAFPPSERAMASALLSIPAVVAPATGPVLGGYLVEFQSWRWIFWVNVPIGLTGLLVSWLFLREDIQEHPGHLDIPGFILSAAGLASLVYALSEAGAKTFTDTRVVVFGLAGLAIITAFTFVELKVKEPMIDVRLLRDKLFAATNFVQLVAQGGMQGALFLLPLFLQYEQGLSPLQSGLTTFPQAIGVVMMVQPAAHLYKRLGPRRMMMAGMAGITVTTLAFYWVGLDTGQWTIRGIMLARGWAFALTLIPLQTATFATIRNQDTGRASAIFNSGRQVAASFGVALLGTVLTLRMTHYGGHVGPPVSAGAVSAFQEGFLAAAALAAVGIVASLLIDDKAAAETMAERRDDGAADTDLERVPVGAH
ncbi:MAG TPA: MDR family MFS transporter [Dehalococcoidia bacterium]|nr:MDR family MFS transporter [Dehalococcoidia bacterium]